MSDPVELHQCQITNCGFVYDPSKPNKRLKTPAGTTFESLPMHWKCPVCGASKDKYKPVTGPGSVLEDGK